MSVLTESNQEILNKVQTKAHQDCIICGKDGIFQGLDFKTLSDGTITACIGPQKNLQGYNRLLHGGILSSILDSAMTNCLFAHDIIAVTAKLEIQFRHPVKADAPLQVKAEIVRSQSPLYVLSAEIYQDNKTKIKATGKFMEYPEVAE